MGKARRSLENDGSGENTLFGHVHGWGRVLTEKRWFVGKTAEVFISLFGYVSR